MKLTKIVSVKNNRYVSINCPVCGYEQCSHPYPQHYPRLVVCGKCRFWYTNPRLKDDYLPHLYDHRYFNSQNSALIGYSDYLADEDKIRKTFKRRLASMKQFVADSGRVLDIGCAAGFFLDEIRGQGWQVEGIEISKPMVDYAKNKLGLDVWESNFDKIQLKENTYQLVTMWDVIEHLANPLDALKKIYRALAPGGYFVFTTPDVGSIPARIMKHKWIGFKLSDEHLGYYSIKTIDRILQTSSLSLINHEHVGKYVSPDLFVKRVKTYNKTISGIAENIFKIFTNNYSFYANALDIVQVYAKKD